MLYMPKIGNYFKILIDEEVKDFVVINFGVLNLQEKHCIIYLVNNKS